MKMRLRGLCRQREVAASPPSGAPSQFHVDIWKQRVAQLQAELHDALIQYFAARQLQINAMEARTAVEHARLAAIDALLRKDSILVSGSGRSAV